MIENKKVIACYIRLSEDDEDTAKGIKDESNSVSAQRQLIRSYIEKEPDFQGYGIKEYVDDGYTGTTFTRPGYEQLMADAKRGDVGVIVVKDFSRLGRDHLETGNLLERIFPLLQIRFISVNDNYDSADCNGMTGGLSVALKNVMNAMYSRDLSGKVISAMTTRAKNGQYMAAKVPYGYRKDPENKHQLIVDNDAAEVMKLIFTYVAEGKSKGWIVGYLNSNGIPTPSEYFIARGMYAGHKRNKENPMWTVTTISDMLRNPVYIGNTCWNKSSQNISTGKKNIKNGRDEWIVTEGTHEAIISKELFDKANEMAFTGKKKPVTGKACPLIYCAYCGRTLSAPKNGTHTRYRCMNGYGQFAEEECKRIRIKGTDLEGAVLANVNLMAQIYTDQIGKKKESESEVSAISDRIETLSKNQQRLSSKKTRLYEEYRNDGNREDYIAKKQKTDDRLAEIASEIKEAESRLEVAKQNDIMATSTREILQESLLMESFDKVQLKKIIDRINVYGPDRIEIIWKPLDAVFQGITAGIGVVDL